MSVRSQIWGVRDNAGETIPSNPSAPNGGGSDDEDPFKKKSKAGFSAFASAGLTDDIAVEDDDDGGGGLMVRFTNHQTRLLTLNQSYHCDLTVIDKTKRKTKKRQGEQVKSES